MDKQIHVAAYARVSTNLPSQENSLISQREHWNAIISAHRNWKLYDLYIEKGVSGTSAEGRPELKRLIADCNAGKVDFVVTKSISRFSRNVMDCLEICRKLKRIGVAVFFEKENVRTDTADGELMLTLFATVAEEESRSIQTNSQWAVQKRFQNGTYRFSKAPFGYSLSLEGKYVVDPSTASVVREIYETAVNGVGTPTIAKRLQERGISTGTRRRDGSEGVWTSSMVRGILTNAVYKGDLLMQKTYTDRDYKTRVNNGERDQYFVHDDVLAIVTPDLWEKANDALRSRRTSQANRLVSEDPIAPNRRVYSGKLRCARCGHNYKRVVKGSVCWWACQGKLKDRTSCNADNIREEDIQNAFSTMINKLKYLAEAMPAGDSSAVEKMFTKLNSTEENADLFSDIVSRADVAYDRIIFHLKCGLTLAESLVPTTLP